MDTRTRTSSFYQHYDPLTLYTTYGTCVSNTVIYKVNTASTGTDNVEMWDGFVEQTPLEKLFEASAHIAAKAKKEQPSDPLDLALKRKITPEPPSWFDKLIGRDYVLEDTLGNLILVLLEHDAEKWEFGAEQATYGEMHVKVNYPSPKKVNFYIRSSNHKTQYTNVIASKAMRRRLYKAVIDARNQKILKHLTGEVKKEILLISDHRETK